MTHDDWRVYVIVVPGYCPFLLVGMATLATVPCHVAIARNEPAHRTMFPSLGACVSTRQKLYFWKYLVLAKYNLFSACQARSPTNPFCADGTRRAVVAVCARGCVGVCWSVLAGLCRYCTSGKRPHDVPSNPNTAYRDCGWNGWADFFGPQSGSKKQRKKRRLKKGNNLQAGASVGVCSWACTPLWMHISCVVRLCCVLAPTPVWDFFQIQCDQIWPSCTVRTHRCAGGSRSNSSSSAPKRVRVSPQNTHKAAPPTTNKTPTTTPFVSTQPGGPRKRVAAKPLPPSPMRPTPAAMATSSSSSTDANSLASSLRDTEASEMEASDTEASEMEDAVADGTTDTASFLETHNVVVGSQVLAKDVVGKWLNAVVVRFDATKSNVLVHFDGWDAEFDEWVEVRGRRLRESTTDADTNTDTRAPAMDFGSRQIDFDPSGAVGWCVYKLHLSVACREPPIIVLWLRAC